MGSKSTKHRSDDTEWISEVPKIVKAVQMDPYSPAQFFRTAGLPENGLVAYQGKPVYVRRVSGAVRVMQLSVGACPVTIWGEYHRQLQQKPSTYLCALCDTPARGCFSVPSLIAFAEPRALVLNEMSPLDSKYGELNVSCTTRAHKAVTCVDVDPRSSSPFHHPEDAMRRNPFLVLWSYYVRPSAEHALFWHTEASTQLRALHKTIRTGGPEAVKAKDVVLKLSTDVAYEMYTSLHAGKLSSEQFHDIAARARNINWYLYQNEPRMRAAVKSDPVYLFSSNFEMYDGKHGGVFELFTDVTLCSLDIPMAEYVCAEAARKDAAPRPVHCLIGDFHSYGVMAAILAINNRKLPIRIQTISGTRSVIHETSACFHPLSGNMEPVEPIVEPEKLHQRLMPLDKPSLPAPKRPRIEATAPAAQRMIKRRRGR